MSRMLAVSSVTAAMAAWGTAYHRHGLAHTAGLAAWVANNLDPSLSWPDVDWLRSITRLPVLLKGPTGCGKTRFVEHMAARLGRPLITVSCHDDLSAADLVGRHLISGGATVWSDGPLARAVRARRLVGAAQ